jgi:hypothetical protein
VVAVVVAKFKQLFICQQTKQSRLVQVALVLLPKQGLV